VAAYGKILTEPILATPRLGLINVHASLLPRWRSRSCLGAPLPILVRRYNIVAPHLRTPSSTGVRAPWGCAMRNTFLDDYLRSLLILHTAVVCLLLSGSFLSL
jgi:hypothetical protein